MCVVIAFEFVGFGFGFNQWEGGRAVRGSKFNDGCLR